MRNPTSGGDNRSSTFMPVLTASATPQDAKSTRESRSALYSAVTLGFLARLAIVFATKAYLFPPTAPLPPSKANFFFGFEIGRVARSIASGHGFGSPFHIWTGPTAWYPPVYPYLLAGVFKLFGIYSPTSGVVILTFNSLLAALTCLPLYFLANWAGGRRVALWSAWLWAITPIFFTFDVKWAWETSLSTLLLVMALAASVKLAEAADWQAWFGTGVLWGVIALTNTSLLSLMPFALAWSWWNSEPTRAKTGHVWGTPARNLLIAFAVMFLTVLPWMARNRAVMGRWIFVRDNFWAEMRFGNADASRGIWLGWMNPTNNDTEQEHYARVGELQYIAEKKAAVQSFIRHNPAFFADLCVRRFFLYWCDLPTNWAEDLSAHDVVRDQWITICFSGLAWVGMFLMLRRRFRAAALLAPALLVYPCLYYIASPDPRYRHPIETVMLLFAVYAVSATGGRWSSHPSKTC